MIVSGELKSTAKKMTQNTPEKSVTSLLLLASKNFTKLRHKKNIRKPLELWADLPARAFVFHSVAKSPTSEVW